MDLLTSRNVRCYGETMTEPDPQPTRLTYDVPAGYRENERLDVYLTGMMQNATRSKVQRGIRKGHVIVNGEVVEKPAASVQAGDVIECTVMKPPPVEVLPEPMSLDIRYEDEHLMVVNKPAGMVVHPAYGHRTGTLVHGLLYHVGADALGGDIDDDDLDEIDLSTINARPRGMDDPVVRPGIVHRLDKDTSGLLVVAKNDVAHAGLAKQFMERTTRRRYLAVVWGVPQEEAGSVESHLGRDPRDRKRMAVVPEERGKWARTHWKIEEPFGTTSLLEFRLETGRTHQIRVHAAHINHPVFSDAVYGGDRMRYGRRTGNRRAFIRNQFDVCSRQALHAATLGFKHPRTGEQMDFSAELPDDMATLVENLRGGDHG